MIVLQNWRAKSSSHIAGDFCSKDIVKLKPTDTLHDAVKMMHKSSISQIPVFNNSEVVGVISGKWDRKPLGRFRGGRVEKSKTCRHHGSGSTNSGF